MRGAIKRVLGVTGLLGPAVRLRRAVWSLRFRRGNRRFWREGAPDGLPLPPLDLMIEVAASPDIAWFLESGRLAAESLRSVLARNGVDLSRLRAVLDFGCGCGRVTRHWAGLGAAVHGSDLNPRLVDWCRRSLPFARFETNSLAPGLRHGDGAFDLVYALSVFTHLPEPLQRPWMDELQRVLADGGLLAFSTHGARYLPRLRPEDQERFRAGQLVVTDAAAAGSNLCAAYHPESYVRETLARGLRVIDFLPEGAAGNPHQDLYLLRKGPSGLEREHQV